jgi:hypothetical protein
MMALVDILVFITAAGFTVIVIATILVIIGVRQEERYKTLRYKSSPTDTFGARTRLILGAIIRDPKDNSEITRTAAGGLTVNGDRTGASGEAVK